MKRWFFVDITTTCHERVAVKAADKEDAKDFAAALVDAGTIDFADAGKAAYGSVNDSIVVADEVGRGRPPNAMRQFDGVEELQ
jgi:sulfite reductase alpha subunit-like flavoprotein